MEAARREQEEESSSSPSTAVSVSAMVPATNPPADKSAKKRPRTADPSSASSSLQDDHKSKSNNNDDDFSTPLGTKPRQGLRRTETVAVAVATMSSWGENASLLPRDAQQSVLVDTSALRSFRQNFVASLPATDHSRRATHDGGASQFCANSAGDFALGAMVNAFRLLNPTAQSAVTHPRYTLPSTIRQSMPSRRKVPQRMSELAQFVADGSQVLRNRFNTLMEIETKRASMVIPPAFQEKVKAMFSKYPDGLSGIADQSIITIYNKFTDEYSLFNEVRRYRPGYLDRLKPEEEEEVRRLYNEGSGADACDFCSMVRTAEDVFGRIASKHCYIASNVAKYEQWHSLIVSRHHSPLAFSAEIFRDYFATAQKWFEAVHRLDRDAVFPVLSWDAGPRASASQIHQHMHLVLTHDRYLGKAESTRRAAANFERKYPGTSYWQEIAVLHAQVGLAVVHKNTIILSHMAPIKEREIIVISPDHTSEDFAEAIGAALGALRDDVGVRAFSMGIAFKPVGAVPKFRGASPAGHVPLMHLSDEEELDRKMMQNYPTVARIVDRGSPLDQRSDVGAMEFFGANNVGADPFFIMPHLLERVRALDAKATLTGGGVE